MLDKSIVAAMVGKLTLGRKELNGQLSIILVYTTIAKQRI